MRPALRVTDWAVATVPACDCTRVLPRGPNQASCQPGIWRPSYWNYGVLHAGLRPPATRAASLRTRTGHACLNSRQRGSSQWLMRSFAVAAAVLWSRRASRTLRRENQKLTSSQMDTDSSAAHRAAPPASMLQRFAVQRNVEAGHLVLQRGPQREDAPTSRSSAKAATPHHNAGTSTP